MRSHDYYIFFVTLLWCFINLKIYVLHSARVTSLWTEFLYINPCTLTTHSHLYFCRLASDESRNERKLLWACYSRYRHTSVFSQCPIASFLSLLQMARQSSLKIRTLFLDWLCYSPPHLCTFIGISSSLHSLLLSNCQIC